MSPATPPVRKRIQWRLECLAFLTVERLLGLVPLPALWRIGAALSCWSRLVPGRRRIVADNLRTILGPGTPESVIAETTREVFRRTTANLLSSLKGARMSNRQIARAFEVENQEVMDRAIAKGKGVILVLSHMGNWEILAQTPPVYYPDQRGGTLYRPLNNIYLDRILTARRKANGTELFARLSSLHAPIAFLRAGGLLGILSDQRSGPHGFMVPLFGRLVSITPIAGLLRRRTDSPIIGLSMRTKAPGRWVVKIHDLPLPGDTPATSAHIASLLEEIMRESIPDGFWLADPWRLNSGFPLALDSKRGPLILKERRDEPLHPLRVLVRVPDRKEEARATLPALRALAASRPDLEVLLLGLDPAAAFWKEAGFPHRFIPYRGDTAHLEAAIAIVLTSNEVSARDLPRVFGGPIYSLPETAPPATPHWRQWRRIRIRKPHRDKEKWLACLLSLGMPDPPRKAEYV